MVPIVEICIRIAAAFIASLLFGLERQAKKKPVGFGTFTFVAVGAATLTIVAQNISDNPVTILGSIITGIGFLGAGAIIKSGDKKIVGITTAASIWAFAALGITLGLGQYTIAAILYGLTIVIMTMDYFFERHGFGQYSKSVTITLNDAAKVRDVEKMLPANHKITTYNFDSTKKEYTISFFMSGNKREINMTLNEFVKHNNVLKIVIE